MSAGTVMELRQRLVEEPEEEERGFEADADEDDGERARGRASSRNVSRGR